jgi:hypothetical protein
MNPSQPRCARTAFGCPATAFALAAETSLRMLPKMIPRHLPQMPEAKVPRRGQRQRSRASSAA